MTPTTTRSTGSSPTWSSPTSPPGSVDAGAPALSGGRPLDVAWVWPLSADPAFLPDGTADPAVVDQLAPTGRLGRQAAFIDSLTDLPLTLAPSPETLDGWLSIARQRTDLASGIAAVQRAASRNEILAGPFVPLDLPALTAADLDGSFDSEFTRGTTTLDRVLGTRLDPRTALPGPLDQHTAQTLRQRGVDRLVVDDPSGAVRRAPRPSRPRIPTPCRRRPVTTAPR